MIKSGDFLKVVFLCLGLLILFQSCTAYRKPVTLDEAVLASDRVKVKTKNGQKLKYDRMGFEEGKYFGVKEVNGEILKLI